MMTGSARTHHSSDRIEKEMSVAHADFSAAVDAYRQALNAFVKGAARPVHEHFSRRDDVTLANPLGPPRLGRADVEQAVEAAAANFEDGSLQFDDLSRYATADLGYVVSLERADVRLAGSDETVPSSLRVTMIFRREADTWKVVHRHADPITTAQPISTILTVRPRRAGT
jgi:ketosteroid isomerase-like protein